MSSQKNRIQSEKVSFQEHLLSWYNENKRKLPWRRDRHPYHILLSEIMLQQTQVSRVIPKYEAWLRAFPTIEALAQAKTADVLRLWSGLGYNHRALYLQRTAQTIVNESKGVWPRTVAGLKKLPGIGEYTARAVACFAFNEQVAVVDTNVRKVLLTKLCHPEWNEGSIEDREEMLKLVQHDKISEKDIQYLADQLLPKGRAYEWNQALMDYASVMLKQEKIPVKKQSPFKNSNRYYRGQTVKKVLEYHVVSIRQLAKLLNKDEIFTESIVRSLVKDGLVTYEEEKVQLRA